MEAAEPKAPADKGKGSKSGKRFEIKKWNAVAMWSWAICTDTCAICRNNLYEPSIEYQANPTGAAKSTGFARLPARVDTACSCMLCVQIHAPHRRIVHQRCSTQGQSPSLHRAAQATTTTRGSASRGATAATSSTWTASNGGSRRAPPARCATRCAAGAATRASFLLLQRGSTAAMRHAMHAACLLPAWQGTDDVRACAGVGVCKD